MAKAKLPNWSPAVNVISGDFEKGDDVRGCDECFSPLVFMHRDGSITCRCGAVRPERWMANEIPEAS